MDLLYMTRINVYNVLLRYFNITFRKSDLTHILFNCNFSSACKQKRLYAVIFQWTSPKRRNFD